MRQEEIKKIEQIYNSLDSFTAGRDKNRNGKQASGVLESSAQ